MVVVACAVGRMKQEDLYLTPPPKKKESRKKVKRKEEVGDGQKLGQEITEVKKIYSGSTVRSFLLWPIA